VTQKLLDAFPGLPANSRAAHLRFLHGDPAGAIGLLEESLGSAPPGSEAHAWAFLQLAELHLNGGQLGRAEKALAGAEDLFPGRPEYPALWARLREAQGRPAEALALLREALELYPNPD
jgi:tetratricopeptide (TPR) repeat protein